MDESKRKSPYAKKPLTREDVLRLIEEHGGPEGLDLSQADLRGADLSELDLHGADLREAILHSYRQVEANLQGTRLGRANLQGANLTGANLQGAVLSVANLQGAVLFRASVQGGYLAHANLQRAYLGAANLQEADLRWANLQGANLPGADLRRARLAGASLWGANLESVNWGDYKLGDEVKKFFDEAASVYRALKQWHTNAGMYDIAGEFHYREMEARRKLACGQLRIPYLLRLRLNPLHWKQHGYPFRHVSAISWKNRRLPDALSLNALRLLYGYGERLRRLIGWAAAVVFGLALVHWAFGTVTGGFLDALYYSAVSFPALGYGDWAPEPQGWAGRFLGAAESFMGVFMMALFLVTFTRKMTR